jgi:hypothetical protein
MEGGFRRANGRVYNRGPRNFTACCSSDDQLFYRRFFRIAVSVPVVVLIMNDHATA